MKLAVVWLSLGFMFSVAQAEETRIEKSEEAVVTSTLRKRQHALSWRYDSGKSKTEGTLTAPVNSSLSSEKTSGEMNIGYLYNWGFFELGAGASSTVENYSTSEDKNTSAVFYGQVAVNFIENKPGNDFIPYVGLAVGSYTEEGDDSTVSLTRILGKQAAFAFGFKWFPLGEILALDVTLYSSSNNIDISGGLTGTGKVTRSGLGVGFLFYF